MGRKWRQNRAVRGCQASMRFGLERDARYSSKRLPHPWSSEVVFQNIPNVQSLAGDLADFPRDPGNLVTDTCPGAMLGFGPGRACRAKRQRGALWAGHSPEFHTDC